MSTETTNGPGWAVRGLPAWTVLIWVPLCYSLLIAPVVDSADRHSGWAWVAAAAAALLFTGTVATRFRPGPQPKPSARALLAGLSGLAVATTLAYSADWSSLFVLATIGVGVVLGVRVAPPVILVLTAVATLTVLATDATTDRALTAGLTVLMSGLGTYAFHQLFNVVAELRCTREELARVAVSAERERFARDLHDLLGHTMSVIVVKAEAIRRLAARDSAAAAEHAGDIETIGRDALADIRRAVNGYRGAGLERELRRARSALDAAGVALDVQQRLGTARPVPEDTDVLLGWVVREAVTNVVRHARASRCTIRVEQVDNGLRIDIGDDGQGLQPEGDSGGGIRGLAERVAAAGGRLDARDTGRGFQLVVDVPARGV